MSDQANIGGRIGGSIAPAISCLVFMALMLSLTFAPPTLADDRKADDDFVGWPLKRAELKSAGKSRQENNEVSEKSEGIEREILRDNQSAPLPSLSQRSEVTEQALSAWSNGDAPAIDLPAETSGAAAPTDGDFAAAPADIASPEIAPLKRITPPVRHELILYAPGDFSISVATAERLDQMAMRLRGTRDRISIVAHSSSQSGSLAGSLAGNAQISTHEAVKLSFKRAMLVRLYLIEEGVSPDQIDLEALPRPEDGGPEDRVEISATSRAARR